MRVRAHARSLCACARSDGARWFDARPCQLLVRLHEPVVGDLSAFRLGWRVGVAFLLCVWLLWDLTIDARLRPNADHCRTRKTLPPQLKGKQGGPACHRRDHGRTCETRLPRLRGK